MHSIGRHERKKVWEAITRRAILDATVRVISKTGMEGLKMESIAHEAGVAKGTLYQYFKDKQDLVHTTLEASVQPLLQEIESVLDCDLSPKEKIEKFVCLHLEYFDDRQQLFRVLIYDRHMVQSRCRRYGSERYRYFLQKLAAVLEEGMKLGEFKQMDASSLAAILMESNIAMINQRLLAERPSSLADDCALIMKVFFQGILSEQPAENRI